MKKIFIFALVLMLIASVFMTVCAAEEVTASDGTVGVSYSDKEQAIRDIIDTMLNEGDELFAEQPWWQVFACWVKEHVGEIVAGVGGFVTLIGALLVLLKTNPKLKAWITSFGKSCKAWFESISDGIDKLKKSFSSVDDKAEKVVKKIDRLERCVLGLVEAFEDVVKLSGADEGKKEIYIKQIEQAKAAVNDEK